MQKLHNIRGIFFDLGGTLIYPPSGNWSFSDLAYRYFPKEALETPPAQAALREARAELDKNHLLHSMEEEYAKFYRFYATLAEALPELGLTDGDLKAITEDKVYNKKDNYRLFDDTRATLEALRGRYRLGIISDTWPSIVPSLEHMDILKYFDCITFSYKLGVFKPDPRMYQDALGKMGLPAGETVFVDDLSGNLLAARDAGIQPVLTRALNHTAVWPDVIPPREDMPNIDRISGLLALL